MTKTTEGLLHEKIMFANSAGRYTQLYVFYSPSTRGPLIEQVRLSGDMLEITDKLTAKERRNLEKKLGDKVGGTAIFKAMPA